MLSDQSCSGYLTNQSTCNAVTIDTDLMLSTNGFQMAVC